MNPFAKKKSRISTLDPVYSVGGTQPRQNVYNEFNRFAPNPPPVATANDEGRFSRRSIKNKLKDNDEEEKYSYYKMLLRQEERMKRELSKKRCSYSNLLCCCCFPCFPMWARTMCCFTFSILSILIVFLVIFVFTFKQPQVVFSGNVNPSQLFSEQGDLQFEYSVYNGNFFGVKFENIKAVAYYPTTDNKTLVGVGAIDDIYFSPQTVTNMTLVMQLMNNGESSSSSSSSNSTAPESKIKSNKEAFINMIQATCGLPVAGNSKEQHKDIVVTLDLMTTVRLYGSSTVTLAFTGQKTRMSCDKMETFIQQQKE